MESVPKADLGMPKRHALSSRNRLAAVRVAQEMLRGEGELLDEIISLIKTALSAPVALVSFVTDDQQIFQSADGLPEPAKTDMQTPISHSFCQHVVTSSAPLIVCDAVHNPQLCDNLAIKDLGLRAYLGAPITNSDGYVLGSLCAIDTQTRSWTDRDLAVLKSLSKTITAQLAVNSAIAREAEVATEYKTTAFDIMDALKSSRTGLWSWSAKTGEAYWPPETCALFGFPPEGYPKTLKEFHGIISSENSKFVTEEVGRQLKLSNIFDIDIEIFPPRMDNPIWVRVRGRVEYNRDGKLHHISGQISDVDMVRRSNLELKQTASRLERITQHAPVMLAEFDTEMCYVFADESYAKMFGKTPKQLIGQSIEDIIGPEAFAETLDYMRAALGGDLVEYNFLSKDLQGSPKQLKVKYAPELGETGQVSSVIAAIIDITHEASLKSKADQLSERLNAAHDLSPDGFMVFKAIRDEHKKITDFRFEYTNQAGADIAGRPLEDLIGKRLLDVLPGNKDA